MNSTYSYMKKLLTWIKKNPSWAIIAALVIVIIFLVLKGCGRGPGGSSDCVSDTVYSEIIIPGDSIPFEKIIPGKPYPVYRDTGSTNVVILPADTLQIVMAYLTENFYSITMLDDTGAYIKVDFSVWANEVQDSVKLTFMNRRPWHISQTIVDNKTIEEAKFKVYAGLSVGGWMDRFSLSPELYFNISRSHLLGVGYDVIGETIDFHYACKISFKNLLKKKK